MARLAPAPHRDGVAAARPADRVDDRPPSVLHGEDRRWPGDARVQGLGDITSMSQADGYIEIPAQTDIVEKGEIVDVKLF
jgi:molybdopterin biosynthesis enzyme